MRIGRADFDVGNIGRVHQAVLGAVPEEEAVEESELRAVYDQVVEENKPSFEKIMENLSYQVVRRQMGDRIFYMRKVWLSSTEVARRYGIAKRTVQSWGQRGIAGARNATGRLQFAAKEVEELVRGVRRTPTPGVARLADPVLTQVWDNDKDAQYERL